MAYRRNAKRRLRQGFFFSDVAFNEKAISNAHDQNHDFLFQALQFTSKMLHNYIFQYVKCKKSEERSEKRPPLWMNEKKLA